MPCSIFRFLFNCHYWACSKRTVVVISILAVQYCTSWRQRQWCLCSVSWSSSLFFLFTGHVFSKTGWWISTPPFLNVLSLSSRSWKDWAVILYCSSVIHHVRMSPTHPAPPRARGVRFRPHPQNATFHNASTLVRKALAWEQVRRFWKEAGII